MHIYMKGLEKKYNIFSLYNDVIFVFSSNFQAISDKFSTFGYFFYTFYINIEFYDIFYFELIFFNILNVLDIY